MRSDEAILDEIIKDGSVEVDEWPELLKRLLTRLDHIAHNSFPTYPLPPPAEVVPTSLPPPPELSTQSTIPDAPSPNPETPAETPAEFSPPAHSQDVSAATSPRPMPPPALTPLTPPPVVDPPVETTLPPGTLAPDDLSVLTTLINILNTQFDTAPPYTVQRFAELLRNPNAHYRSLTKYLRALQRVLSVSSPVTAFPLPPSAVETIPNGTTFTLGSDESLGGALLSPIPWLTPTALTDEVSEESVNGVTQGELLRQEQELNIVPAVQVNSPQPHGDELSGGPPPPLGPEDVGPQPEGTVFPDPPRTPEEARSPPPILGSLLGIDTAMEEAKEEVKEEAKEEEMKDASPEKEEEKKKEEVVEKKDDMDVDLKEAKELEDKMQLDAAADGKEEKEAKEAKEAAKGEN